MYLWLLLCKWVNASPMGLMGPGQHSLQLMEDNCCISQQLNGFSSNQPGKC